MKSVEFEIRPQYEEFMSQGPDPSLRRLIFEYYKKFVDGEEAQKLTDRYISEICKATN